ncbi:MgtC/SapB family protein [Candidatus Woesearchaeota archaeon]|nr:MAG: MgtC/SapB family protein [Candidatus Woesearchaeota archaeon]
MVWEELIKILVSMAIGCVIGWERKHRDKPVGMRTMSLVCMGATLATMAAVKYYPNDTGRIIAGIVTGIGFLGAGAIISKGDSVHGLTTATSIWALAIIGMIVGLGDFVLALMASGLMFFMLQFDILKQKLHRHSF